MPDLSALLYSSLPENFKTPVWFAVCWLQEANQLLYSLLSISFIFQLHILLRITLSRELKILVESSRHCAGNAADLQRIIRQVRTIQLLVNLFNAGHRNVIYCIKLLCIMLATVNGYGAIAHGGSNVVYFLLASSIFCDMVFLYAFVYDSHVKLVARGPKVAPEGSENGPHGIRRF